MDDNKHNHYMIMMTIAIVVKINVDNNIIRKKAYMIMVIVIKVISMVMMKTIIVMQW